MLFSTLEFWFFFAIVLVLYRMASTSIRQLVLLFSSYVFYSFWDWRFCFLLIFSTLIDYYCGYIAGSTHQHKKRLALMMSLLFNLGALGIFKYYNFFVQEFLQLFGLSDAGISSYLIKTSIPWGISFYTFQTLSYTVDCYRGKIKPYSDFIPFANYVAFFPQLLAGPIERAHHLVPQIKNTRFIRLEELRESLFLILWGLFKKCFIAQSLYLVIDSSIHQEQIILSEFLLSGILMTFVVYADFSSYSDIARGLAKFFGIELMINFKPFYFAKTPSEFWQKWHISLTTWIQDYVFNPLVRGKNTKRFPLLWLFVTMLLIGLWHKASWAWLGWGFFAGSFQVLFRIGRGVLKGIHFPTVISSPFLYLLMLTMYLGLGTFHLIDLIELSRLSQIFQNYSKSGDFFQLLFYALPLILTLMALDLVIDRFKNDRKIISIQYFLMGIFIVALLFYTQGNSGPFIYYEF